MRQGMMSRENPQRMSASPHQTIRKDPNAETLLQSKDFQQPHDNTLQHNNDYNQYSNTSSFIKQSSLKQSSMGGISSVGHVVNNNQYSKQMERKTQRVEKVLINNPFSQGQPPFQYQYTHTQQP